MGYNIHDLGDSVRVRGVYTDPDNDDALQDPSVVKLSVRDPAGETGTYVYGTDAEVVRDSIGDYHADIDVDQSGWWYYRWWSTGTGQAADEQRFKVQEAKAV